MNGAVQSGGVLHWLGLGGREVFAFEFEDGLAGGDEERKGEYGQDNEGASAGFGHGGMIG